MIDKTAESEGMGFQIIGAKMPSAKKEKKEEETPEDKKEE